MSESMDAFTFRRVYDAENEQANALSAAADEDVTRDDMAGFYADCIIADRQAKDGGEVGVDFKAVNASTLKRWSPSGLNYVKKKAWRLLRRQAGPR